MLFSKEQEKAILTKNKNILVSAAAGSGKTTVLVERIIETILNPKNNTNIDELLVVTFTRNAADEMKNRIYKVINKTINQNNDNIHLRNQIYLLNKSYITTIDSFCLNIVRQNFKILDIDPNFKIGDESEIELLKIECLNEFLDNLYELEDKDLEKVLNVYSSKVDDKDFLEEFLTLYNKLQNICYYKKWLKNSIECFNITNKEDLFKTDIFNLAINGIKEDLNTAKDIVKEIENILSDFEKPKFLIEDLNFVEKLLLLLKNNKYDIFFEELENLKFERINLKFLKGYDDSGEIDSKIKFLRTDNFKKIFEKKIKKHIPYELKEILNHNKKVYPVLKSLCKIMLDFDDYFLNIKKNKKIFTFNDISHFCLNILLDEKEGKKVPSKIAEEYQLKFKEIIIDEYQDINSIQELILSSISKRNNLFMVGDMKQCIYKFRNSNPNIFLEKYKIKNDDFNEVINLNKNFRSNKNVIDSINFIFEQIMDNSLGEVDYNKDSRLNFSANFEDLDGINKNISQKSEFYIIDNKELIDEEDDELKDLQNIELEANFIVKKIQNLMENFQIFNRDSGKYEPIKYKDIVILLRSVKDSANLFSKTLNENGIPAFTKTSNGFFDFIEISLILNILKIIDNPLQDLELVSVLHSPIFCFTPEELLEVKIYSKSGNFYNQILNYISSEDIDENIKNKLKNFVDKLKSWQKLSIIMSISEILMYIYEDSNYYNYIGLLPKGKIRQANLISLLEKSILFEKTNIKGIFNFIKYIDKIKKGSQEGDSSVLSEDEDLVRIMSIHKSKGLEFPVVFIPMLGKTFNKKELNNKIILHNDYGIGTSFVDNFFSDTPKYKEDLYDVKIKFDTYQKNVLKNKIKDENLSEEIRILYVGLTRAKEKLILVGSCKDISKKESKWEIGRLSKGLIKLNSDSFLDWIGIATKMENNFFIKNIVKKDDLYLNSNKKIKEKIPNLEFIKNINSSIKYSDRKDEINEKLNWIYPNNLEQNLKIKNTISEIKRNYQKEILGMESFDNLNLNMPNFYKNNNSYKISSMEKGKIYHTLLEHIDFNINSKEELNIFMENIKFLEKYQLDIIDKDKILSLLKSDLVKRIRNSKIVKREQSFIIGLSPYEVYHKEIYKNIHSKILVNGIIDLYFEEEDGIVLLDYKTDKTSNIDIIRKNYSIQLNIYKKALEKSKNKKVKEIIIYLIKSNKYFNI